MMFGDPSDDERCPHCGKFPVIGPPGCCAMAGEVPDRRDPTYLPEGPLADIFDSDLPVDVDYTGVVRETQQAWLLEMPDGGAMWFPKAHVSGVRRGGGTFQCAAWLLREKGLFGLTKPKPESKRSNHAAPGPESKRSNHAIRQKIAEIQRQLDELKSLLDG